ncbi:MAG: DUF1302 family protein [Massilia sp.]
MRAHFKRPARTALDRLAPGALAALALLGAPRALALELSASGRVTTGAIYRTESADPAFLTTLNASAAGLQGASLSGANADDPNTNFRRHDATSTVVKGVLNLRAAEGGLAGFVRIKAWYDQALRDQARAWGNITNGYSAGQPLSDAGAPPLSRFSGVALADYYVEAAGAPGGMRALVRVGQQSLDWGERVGFAGGLEALNPKDFPAMHRPGTTPEENKVPVPALFGRLAPTPALALEGFYQTRFRPSALDMCGTFWSLNDYLVSGCDRVMSGQPVTNDRDRLKNQAYIKRIATPKPDGAEFGVGLNCKPPALGTDLGLYLAHYTGRTQIPSLRKSSRAGAALIAGDPNGQNVAFFTEYAEAIRIAALSFSHKRGATSVFGELSYRPNFPLLFSPSDVLPGFLSATAPALLRADVNAVAPGALFHAYDRYPFTQAQIGVQHDWTVGAATAMSAHAELVAKHVGGLPDQAVRRYGRHEIFGTGPIGTTCVVNTPDAAKQCSLRGYVTSDAYAYRLRLDARWREVLPRLNLAASMLLVHDLRGWSPDNLINEGRKTANLALRAEYRQRYLAELVWAPNWGGDYNAFTDRDQLGFSLGVKF